MVLALMLASALAFSAPPEEAPDTSGWERGYSATLERTLVNDVLRIGGMTLKFVQQRGICPEGSPPECAYRVRYEFRKTVNGQRQVTASVQQFVIMGANGVREEGLAWYDAERLIRNPRRGVLIYYRKGGAWLNEDADCEELETAKDWFMMLAEFHEQRSEFP